MSGPEIRTTAEARAWYERQYTALNGRAPDAALLDGLVGRLAAVRAREGQPLTQGAPSAEPTPATPAVGALLAAVVDAGECMDVLALEAVSPDEWAALRGLATACAAAPVAYLKTEAALYDQCAGHNERHHAALAAEQRALATLLRALAAPPRAEGLEGQAE